MNPTTFPIDGVSTVDNVDLASVAGIMAITVVIVSFLKTVLANIPFFKKVPIFVYTLAVAAGLVLICNKVLGTLQGDLKALIVQVISAAIGSNGIFTLVTGKSLKGVGSGQDNNDPPKGDSSDEDQTLSL